MRLVLLTLLGASTLFAYAGFPIGQKSSHKGTVRIETQTVGRTGVGTGTILKAVEKDGRGKLCVLTADHVISVTGKASAEVVHWEMKVHGDSVGVASWSGNVKVLARQGRDAKFKGTTRWDMAVLEVDYGTVDDRFRALAKEVVKLEAYKDDEKDFTAYGYGRSGSEWNGQDGGTTPIGWLAETGTDGWNWGTQRFWNQKVTETFTEEINEYKYEAARWLTRKPGKDLLGYGSSTVGDSGGPLFFGSGAKIGDIAVKSGIQRGMVNTMVSAGDPSSRFAVLWDKDKFGGTGMIFDQAKLDWIKLHCDSVVPEPGTFAAVALGAGVLLRRRSSRSA